MQNNTIELRIQVVRELKYDETTLWGMFGCLPLTNQKEIILNRFGNFTIRGTCRRLQEGNEYDVIITGPHTNPNPNYDDFYNIIEVKPDKLDTVEAQHKFLRAMITENQANALINAYPNELIVDLIIEEKVDTSKTKGIKTKTLEKIKETLIENRAVETLIAELADADLTFNAISKIVQHYGSADIALLKIEESMYNLCDISGFGFTKVDQYALKKGEKLDSEKRIGAAVSYILLQESQDGHVWMDIEELIKQAVELLELNKNNIEQYLSKEIKNKKSKFHFTKDGKVSLFKLYRDELNSLIDLVRLNENYKPENLNVFEYIEVQEEKQGFKFSQEQKDTIVEAMRHGVFIINGKGGVGKTVSVSGIAAILEATGKTYMSVALSGKASQVLSQKGLHSMTIHRALGAKGFSEFTYNRYNPMPYDAIILDETSMVNAGLFSRLVQAIKTGAKLIIVGDSGQLSGIGHGDILRDLLHSGYFKGRELIQIHRQAEESGIIEVASKVRDGQQLTNYNTSIRDTYGKLQDQTIMTFQDRETVAAVLKNIIDNYKEKLKVANDLMDFQILVANRDRGELSVQSINLYAQSVYNDLSKPFVKRGVYEYREGDKVIAKGNSYEIQIYHSVDSYNNPKEIDYFEMLIAEEEGVKIQNPNYSIGDLYNGTMGIVKQVDTKDKTLLIEFQGINGVICLKQDELDNIQMAYAITTHSSQGSTIKNVVFAVDFVAFKLLSKQLIYTGITRASGKCVLLAENNALHKAIATDLSGNRRTHMQDLIADIDKIKKDFKEKIYNVN